MARTDMPLEGQLIVRSMALAERGERAGAILDAIAVVMVALGVIAVFPAVTAEATLWFFVLGSLVAGAALWALSVLLHSAAALLRWRMLDDVTDPTDR